MRNRYWLACGAFSCMGKDWQPPQSPFVQIGPEWRSLKGIFGPICTYGDPFVQIGPNCQTPGIGWRSRAELWRMEKPGPAGNRRARGCSFFPWRSTIDLTIPSAVASASAMARASAPSGRRRTRGLPSPSRYLAGGRRGIQIPSDGTDSAQAWHRQTQAPLRHKKHPYLPAQSTKCTQFSLVSRPSNRDLSTVSVPHATPSPGWPRLWWKTSKARRQGAPHGHAVSEAPFARPSIKGVHHAGMHA